MQDSGAHTLDTRLLRFRSRPGSEDPALLAEDLLHAGRAPDALEVVATGAESRPDDVRLLLVEGQAWMREGDLLRAQAALLKAAKVAPKHKEPFRWLGEVLLKRGDPSRAVKVLERAVAIDPADRALKLLCERAERLSKIADSGGSAEEIATETARMNAPPVDEPPDQQTTVAKNETVSRLRDETRDKLPLQRGMPAAPAAKPAAAPARPKMATQQLFPAPAGIAPPVTGPAAPPARPMAGSAKPTLPAKHFAAAGAGAAPAKAPPKYAAFDEEEEMDTSVLGREELAAAMNRPSPAAPAPPPARSVDDDPPTNEILKPPPGPRHRAGGLRTPDPKPAPAPPPQKGLAFQPPPPVQSAGGRGRPSPFDDTSDPFAAAATSPRAHKAPAFDVEPAPAQIRSPLPPLPLGQPGSDELTIPEDDDALPPPSDASIETMADVAGGEHAGEEENVDSVLRMLEREGIFEPPTGGEAAVWAPKKDIEKAGIKVGRTVAIVWVLAILLAVGGWFGWQWWVEQRHQQAQDLVRQATAESLSGDHANLVDAERHLREARDLDANSKESTKVLLFVQAQRALEEGAFEVGYLRPTILRGRRMRVDEGYLKAAEAVLAAGEGEMDRARQSLASALRKRGDDASILYLAGRLEQRLGDQQALEHLAQAVEREPKLAAAALALAEARADEGQSEEALQLVEGVLSRTRNHLRATLWKAFFTADGADTAQGLALMERLTERLDQGAPTDKVLLELTRARLLRRQGRNEPAGAAVEDAAQAGASEPRLLALVASEARGAGKLARAQQAAAQAVEGAPTNPYFRKLLAEIQIARRDGMRALQTLRSLPLDDPDVLRMTAAAALLVGTDEALRATAEALDRFVAEHADDSNVEIKALRIRAHVRMGEAAQMMEEARALARESPGDPLAAQALGETALAARDPRAAEEALDRLVRASPDDAEGHYLLGRARRMGGDSVGAKQSFERAVQLMPEHVDARVALGSLLLDLGDYAGADRLYTELARRGGIASGAATNLLGRLGRVEALIGRGQLDDAQVQMEGVRPQDRETPSARMTAARLAIARSRPGDAVTAVRPLTEGENVSAEVLALYGDALFEAGETEAAVAAWDRALASDPGYPEALVGRARAEVRGEQPDDARSFLSRADDALRTRIRPPGFRARVLILRGRAFLQSRGQEEQARDVLRQAVAIEGGPADAHFWLGESLAAANSPEARSAYQRYLELAPEGEYASRARRAIQRR